MEEEHRLPGGNKKSFGGTKGQNPFEVQTNYKLMRNSASVHRAYARCVKVEPSIGSKAQER
jgi:hypothetical protein